MDRKSTVSDVHIYLKEEGAATVLGLSDIRWWEGQHKSVVTFIFTACLSPAFMPLEPGSDKILTEKY